jgi:hypothetical protein
MAMLVHEVWCDQQLSYTTNQLNFLQLASPRWMPTATGYCFKHEYLDNGTRKQIHEHFEKKKGVLDATDDLAYKQDSVKFATVQDAKFNLPSSCVVFDLDKVIVNIMNGNILYPVVLDPLDYCKVKDYRFSAHQIKVDTLPHNKSIKIPKRTDTFVLVENEEKKNLTRLLFGKAWQQIFFRNCQRSDYRQANIIKLPQSLYKPGNQYPNVKGLRLTDNRACVEGVYNKKERNFELTDPDRTREEVILNAVLYQMDQHRLWLEAQKAKLKLRIKARKRELKLRLEAQQDHDESSTSQ